LFLEQFDRRELNGSVGDRLFMLALLLERAIASGAQVRRLVTSVGESRIAAGRSVE
jgi:hypothetical protein